ncbi:MAG: hypothetical protein RIS52_80 [Pseudomonadota bacterium]|jgi:PilZ domain
MSLTKTRFDSYSSAAQEDRCAPRRVIQIPAILRPTSEHGYGVEVVDISVAGFSCRVVTRTPVGTRCWITLPGLSGLQSEVVWNNGTMVGCSFTNLLNAAVLDHLLSKFE